jgi:hypothetical protein
VHLDKVDTFAQHILLLLRAPLQIVIWSLKKKKTTQVNLKPAVIQDEFYVLFLCVVIQRYCQLRFSFVLNYVTSELGTQF